MRRFGSLLSLVLVLGGVQLSTRGVTLIVSRIGSGVSALASGLALPISAGRFVTGLVLLGSGLLLGLLGLWVRRIETKASAVGERCPSCASVTHRVKRSRTQRLVSWLVGEDLARRLCDECGWTGLSWRY